LPQPLCIANKNVPNLVSLLDKAYMHNSYAGLPILIFI